MRYEKNRKLFGLDEYLVIKYAKLLAIPLIILILIISVFLLDIFSSSAKKDVATSSVSAKLQDDIEVTQDEDIAKLIQEYQVAKLTADADKLYALFLDTSEIDDNLREKLKEEAKEFEYFTADNIIYAADGAREGEYVIYASMQLKFKKVETTAPMILQAYVVKNADGYHFVMDSLLDKEQRERVVKINESRKVQDLYKALKEELSQKVVDDVNLADRYKDFADGTLKFKDAKDTKESLEAKKMSEEAAGEETSSEESVSEETISVESTSDSVQENIQDTTAEISNN